MTTTSPPPPTTPPQLPLRLAIHSALEFFSGHARLPSISSWVSTTGIQGDVVKCCHDLVTALPQDFCFTWRQACDDEIQHAVVMHDENEAKLVLEMRLVNGTSAKRGRKARLERIKNITFEDCKPTTAGNDVITPPTTEMLYKDRTTNTTTTTQPTRKHTTTKNGPVIFLDQQPTPIPTSPPPPSPWSGNTFYPLGALTFLQQQLKPSAMKYVINTPTTTTPTTTPLPPPPPLHTLTVTRLHQRWNISTLHPHQQQTLHCIITRNKSCVLTTSTASGKTLVFASAIFDTIIQSRSQDSGGGFIQPRKTALIVYPTKALARDQEERLCLLMQHTTDPQQHVQVCVVDGDTPPPARDLARDTAQVILTNPDFIHATMLSHADWKPFLHDLHICVLDEAHVYDATFGSHVAHVLRRLSRLLPSPPLWIVCSATIANPTELIDFLIGPKSMGEFQHISSSDTNTTSNNMVTALWRPRLSLAEYDQDVPISSIYECASLLSHLVSCGVRTLAFCRTRKLVELVLKYTRKQLVDCKTNPDHVMGYRGGYEPQERRQIEQDLLQGRLRGVCATNALELGMDIGTLDAVLVLGFPGSVASMFQQFGRCARSGRPGLAIMLLFQSPIDTWALANATRFLTERRFESVVGELNNDILLSQHLACAAQEKPIDVTIDSQWWAPHVTQDVIDTIVQRLCGDGTLIKQLGYSTTITTARINDFSLRVIDAVTIQVWDIEHGRVLDNVPYHRAFFSLFVGAVFMHQSETYLITSMSVDARRANARKSVLDYFTSAMENKIVDIVKILRQDGNVCEGVCRITWSLMGFTKTPFLRHDGGGRGKKQRQYEEMELPPLVFETRGVWAVVSPSVVDVLGEERVDNGLHALSHVVHKMLPLFTKSAGSLSGLHMPSKSGFGKLLLFDSHPGGGSGVCNVLFTRFVQVLELCEQVLCTCPCTTSGCGECVLDGKCGGYNHGCDDKEAALVCVRDLLQQYRAVATSPVPGNRTSWTSPIKLREANFRQVGVSARLAGVGRIGDGRLFEGRLNVGEEWRA